MLTLSIFIDVPEHPQKSLGIRPRGTELRFPEVVGS